MFHRFLFFFQLSTFLASNLDFFSQPAGFRTRGSSVSTSEAEAGPKCNPAVTGFRQRATGYMSMLGRVVIVTINSGADPQFLYRGFVWCERVLF